MAKQEKPRRKRVARKRFIDPHDSILVPMSPFENRISNLSTLMPPPPWHPDADSIREHVKRLTETDLALRLRLEEVRRRVPLWALARTQGGSGFIMANTLRNFFTDYGIRLLHHGPHSLPASFNVVESFLTFRKDYCLFDLRPEVEHLLTIDEYFNWYATNTMPQDLGVLTEVMREATVYSYNMTNDTSGYRLAADRSTLVIAGVSFVRHDNELSCMLVAGEQPANPSDREAVEAVESPCRPFQGHEDVAPHPDMGIDDRYLDTHPGFARVILLTRFDLRAKKHGVRYILLDVGPSFLTHTDDVRALEGLKEPDKEALLDSGLVGLTQYHGLFSALASLVYLPVACSADPGAVQEVEFASEFGSRKEEALNQEAMGELPLGDCVFSRVVRCMTTSVEGAPDRERVISPPDLQFQSDGFWKPIAPGEVGEDKEGKPIVGRTWVSRKESWSARGPSTFLIRRSRKSPHGPDPGIVYVARTPAHQTDVYKVGLTRRTAEERARELGSTSTPLPFGVMAKWEVGDCAAVEREAHRRLEPYRLNPRREFFCISISEIVSTVEQVVDDLKARG